jgi:hypothetical protein
METKNKKMSMLKINFLTIISGLFLSNGIKAQKPAIETGTFNVSGNCGMCKKTIEKAATIKGVRSASWDESVKVLTLKYDRHKINPEQALRAVAYAGYDNEKYVAPEQAYNNLSGCCQYDRTVKQKPAARLDDNQNKTQQPATNPNVQQKESGIQKIYDQYFVIKDALVKGNSTTAGEAAKQLLSAVKSVNMPALNDKEHDSYMKVAESMEQQTQKITENKNIDKQRMAFSQLSESIYTLMKSVKPGYEVYVDHCPMYNDGKGANWISKEKPIKNPYYGSKMMTCGNVVETLK